MVCTYTFDPGIFQADRLGSLQTLHSAKNISVLVDRGIYDGIVSGPQTDRPKTANIRYLLHPVRVTGVFHPKVILLASASKGRLIIRKCEFHETEALQAMQSWWPALSLCRSEIPNIFRCFKRLTSS